MGGLGGMMRSVRNKVVHAAKSVAQEAQQSAQDLAGDVAHDVLRGEDVRGALKKRGQAKKRALTRRLYAGVTPSVSHKRKPTRGPSQSRPRTKRRRAPPRDVFDDE